MNSFRASIASARFAMAIASSTVNDRRRIDPASAFRIGYRGRLARCVTRLARHVFWAFRRGRRKVQARRPRSPDENRYDPIPIFRPSRVGGRRKRRSHPAITDDVGVDDNHGRPARFQASISAALIWCLNFARAARASRVIASTSTRCVPLAALLNVAMISLLRLR